MIIQKWGCIALTDLKGPAGTYDIKYMGRTWTIIVQDKVGFLLEMMLGLIGGVRAGVGFTPKVKG